MGDEYAKEFAGPQVFTLSGATPKIRSFFVGVNGVTLPDDLSLSQPFNFDFSGAESNGTRRITGTGRSGWKLI